ncbi:hypothetical protein KY285_011120 [Solanum tuberosum]|nr:hypothetical protein KY285_011120 [Solanum tuberosum]
MITSTMIQLLNLKGIPGVSQTAMRLKLFPLSLTGEATNWMNELPNDSIRTWTELKLSFLERFYPESKELQKKDKIGAHKQLSGKGRQCMISGGVCGGSFMRKPFPEIVQLMDEVLKNNRAWDSRDAEVRDLGLTFELSAEQKMREEERDQDMAHMRTQMDLLMKHIMADEEAKYSGNQGGFQNNNSGNKGYNSGNQGRNYSREGQYERPANREQGNWQNRDGYNNDRSGVYVPPGNRDRTGGSSNGSK